jgi:lipoprotein NlpD
MQNMLMKNSNWWCASLGAALIVGGCSSTPNRAPVEERIAGTRPAASTMPAVSASDPSKPLPGIENLGKPGYYAVKTGDTLIRIGLENGQNWKDLVKWNGLDNPNMIEVGQVLRVIAPGIDPNAASSKPITTAKVETKPLDAKAPAAAASGVAPTPSPSTAPSTSATPPAAARDGDDDVNWAWPASGPVVTPFDEGKVKGVAIGGKAGDPVLAAADGRVIYAGSGLRGYGNLIMLKHNSAFLTVYAHNQTLLVKEDQTVRRGQKIAEMGSSDTDSVKLHFEMRRQGKPVDPAKLLPPR